MKEQLTEKEQEEAARQGWLLAPVYDTRGYYALAVLPAGRSSFDTPHDAMQYVWARAKLNDPVCRRALALISASELAGKSKSRKSRKS